MGIHAAVTIVSKNYLAYAETLAASYIAHHPGHEFIVILVDRADGYVGAKLSCGAEVIEVANLAIPDISRFIYRYSIIELNTAVKPFAMADLFAKRKYETLLFLDPDIFVFRRLEHVYEALQNASIVLTPHLLQPYYDDRAPCEQHIIQAGTYNLGFIGLRRGKTAEDLLEWWMAKLHMDCIVDVPNGLFVDQKWIDLVPGYYPDYLILHNKGYNAAYWNLHERPISRDQFGWKAGGQPLYFFHFSGHNPLTPHILSKHQNRHDLAALPCLQELTDFYGRKLLASGYYESAQWPYAFGTLSNGVALPLPLVNAVMQWAIRKGVPTPCPVKTPDAFCRFLMSRGVIPGKPNAIVLFDFIVQLRADLRTTYPLAVTDSDDPGFRGWVKGTGISEYCLSDLLRFEVTKRSELPVTRMFNHIKKTEAGNNNVVVDFWDNPRAYKFPPLRSVGHAPRSVSSPDNFSSVLDECIPSVGRILNIYFLRGDLQQRFSRLWTDHQIEEFCDWLTSNMYDLRLTESQRVFFEQYAKSARVLIEKMRFAYLHYGRRRKLSPNIYEIDRRRYEILSELNTTQVLEFLYEDETFRPVDHYLEYADAVGNGRLSDPLQLTIDGLDVQRSYLFASRVGAGLTERAQLSPSINIAGYFHAPSGMGEAARSLRRTLENVGASFKSISLPNIRAEYDDLPDSPFFFGWPSCKPDLSITVANADATQTAGTFLPSLYWGRRNIGYWLWETEDLPSQYRIDGDFYHEIWTPSAYSAAAIEKSVQSPVKVMRLSVDFQGISLARGNRTHFRLPESGILFGFMFDPDSSMYRKNVAGLVEAFSEAFADNDNCYLILKVNGRFAYNYEYELLRARTSNPRIIFIEKTFSRGETYNFLASLDAYVSLHRAEGFGLTCAESMALGLPVIASNYSGNLEFMKSDNSILVETPTEVTSRRYGPYVAGTKWGNPQKDAAIAALRSLLNKERRAALGEAAKRDINTCLGAVAMRADFLKAAGLCAAGPSAAAVS